MTDAAFEARLERVARRYAETAIRPVDAAQIAAFAIRVGDRPAPRGRLAVPRRGRWLLLALVGGLLTAIVGVAVLSGGGLTPAVPSPSPSPAVTASPSPSVPAASSLTPPPVGSDQTQRGTWIADIPANVVVGRTPGPKRMSLTVDNVPTAAVGIDPGPADLFESSVVTFGVGDIRFTSLATVPADGQRLAGDAVEVDGARLAGCTKGDEGHYRVAESADGLRLTLTLVTEVCPSRQAILARTWTRSLRVPNSGGAGVVDGFEPLFTVVLPTGNYVVDRDPDSTTIRQEFPEFRFLSWKDPQGWNDPCDEAKGRHDIAPGADAFVAYFRQLAGFTVDATTETVVGGHRAIHLVVHANPDASCPSGRLNEWQPKSVTTDLTWFLRPGDTDSLYIVDTPAATVMFEANPASAAREAEVINSIRFLDRLPTTP